MRINLIIPSFYPATVYGGPIFSTLHTCEALSVLDNVEVYVSTTNTNRDSKLDIEKNKWVKFEKDFFVKYYDETKVDKFSLALFLNVWKDIKLSDVVHLQGIFSTPTPISLIYALLFRKPVILSPRGSLCTWCLAQGSRFKRLWMTFVINPFGNRVSWHATSETEKEDILRLFPGSNVHVVPNGIDIQAFSHVNTLSVTEYTERYIGKEKNPGKIIVSMGRLHRVKGFDILIGAFDKLLNYYPEAMLFIAGKDVGERERLEMSVRELGLNERVFFIGEVSKQEKIDFLGNADLFVLPSHAENFGNVYLESLAAGTPVVASTGTPWEAVEKAECGKWVDNNEEDTFRAMSEMLKKDRESMRSNARGLARKYDWRNIAIQFKEVFGKVIDGS